MQCRDGSLGSGPGNGDGGRGACELEGAPDVGILRQSDGQCAVKSVAGRSRINGVHAKGLLADGGLAIPIEAAAIAEFQDDGFGSKRQ